MSKQVIWKEIDAQGPMGAWILAENDEVMVGLDGDWYTVDCFDPSAVTVLDEATGVQSVIAWEDIREVRREALDR